MQNWQRRKRGLSPIIHGNGTWEDLTIVNDLPGSKVVRQSLFGSGTQNAAQMLQNIWIGDPAANEYRRIRYVMGQLGMKDRADAKAVDHGLAYGTQDDHYNHFHVDVRPPTLQAITTKQQLVVQKAPSLDDALPEQALSADTISAWRQDFGFSEEMMMFVPDLPVLPEQYSPILVAEAMAPSGAAMSKTLTAGVCFPVQNIEGMRLGLIHSFGPAGTALNALFAYQKDFPIKAKDEYRPWIESAKITLLEPPTKGKITRTIPEFPIPDNDSYYYNPKPGDMSKDRAVFLVKMGGYTVKVIYTFHPTENGGGPESDRLYCGKRGTLYRIVDEQKKTSGLDPALFTGNLGLGSLNASLPNLTIETADLTGSAVGQTTGTGPTAQITLDTDAAGHGWYLDYTPYLNEEYLPTSNPQEWIAKPGSEAEGKMDMLSVLLHEYGHALGLDHSADSHALMASTLLPGVRRLPSASELALMAGLLGVAKETGSTSPVPYDPFSPPGTPLPMTMSLAAFVAARQRRSSLSSALTQFEVAVNPTLTNPQFADSQGWATAGDVGIAAGAATLKETATTQTRLNQVFVLGANDRFLSFTLSGIALDDVNNAPDDAFEVALIDATTGLSLLGGTGLTHNDAILNQQADGTKYLASGVSTVTNPDGSHTYLVHLAGIAAGTVVNLSFDLIGFGKGAAATSSHVTVKDLHLGVPQEAHDDTATLAEDATQDIDVIANDIGADQPGVKPVLVSGPAHGTVEITAEGRFRYHPDANWSGEDSFSYRLSDAPQEDPLGDGNLDSNIAEVKLTVMPVNDAPVLAANTVTLDEDSQAVIDLLQGTSDIDGDVLTAVVTEGPQHGSFAQNADGTWTYVPNAHWNGSDTVAYTVSDGLAVTTGRFAFVVRPVNDAPIISPIAAMLQEDGSLVLNLQASASDVDGDALTITVDLPGHGELTENADGTWTYRPEVDYHGPDSFTWTVSDGRAATTGAVQLVINAVNDAPVALGDTVTVNEDGLAAFPFQGSDVDGDDLTGRIVSQPTHGSVVQLSANSFSYVPPADWSGEDSFTYVVNDGQLDSSIATIRLIVTPVADAPVLILNDQPGQGREVFRSGWESVVNKNNTSTLIQDKTLDGWTLITRPDQSSGGSNGFEIWSSGDKMMDAGNRLRTVSAMAGDGNNWLELNNSGGDMAQTLGIERTVDTIAGAIYTLSLDLAGRMGYSADYTKIGITVDGVRIGGDASTSATASLNWQTKTFQFTGKGGQQSIRIASEATQFDKDGRGMMLDDITLSEVLPTNTGAEDSTIHLSAISAALKDTDGSETLALTIEAIPLGTTLSDGTHAFIASETAATANITGWNLGQLSLTPPKNFNGSITLTVAATATESANQAKARSEALLKVTVLPVNDAPLASDASITLNEDSSVKIDLAQLVRDVDGDSLSLTLGKPGHGILTRNVDGTFTYTPNTGFYGNDRIALTVSDGKLTASATIRLSVVHVNHPPVWQSTPPTTYTLNASAADEIFKIAGEQGTPGTLNLDWQSRDAGYNNEIGLYRVDDASGRIGTLKPGDAGYAAAALDASRAVVLFASGQGQGARATVQLTAGQYIGLYLIQNASTAQWHSKNPTNALNAGPQAFFSIKSANPDAFDHLRTTRKADGRLELAWEDSTGGGDRDYNDAIIRSSGLVPLTQAFTYQAKASDADGNTLTYRLLDGPQGARIDAATGLLTWSDPQVGSATFRLEADDGKAGKTQQRFTVVVKAAQDGARTASVTVESSMVLGLNAPESNNDSYIVIKQKQDTEGSSVDWRGTPSHFLTGAQLKRDEWLVDLACVKPQEKSLAEITGLRVAVG